MRELKSHKATQKPDVDTSKFDGMSLGEMKKTLSGLVAESKRNGTFDGDKMDEFVEFVSPSLAPEERKRLAELVQMVKSGKL